MHNYRYMHALVQNSSFHPSTFSTSPLGHTYMWNFNPPTWRGSGMINMKSHNRAGTSARQDFCMNTGSRLRYNWLSTHLFVLLHVTFQWSRNILANVRIFQLIDFIPANRALFKKSVNIPYSAVLYKSRFIFSWVNFRLYIQAILHW